MNEPSTGSTLWHGRFEGGPAEALMEYTVSLPFDRQMWPDDIAGSRAHVRGLALAPTTHARARPDLTPAPSRARR